ncbi:Sperm-associated antigen 17 [Desmophyllum pertusum]|uniref:Sperm-associated antigen 17 n=1 Tax=Desmophyllum pertusum TaxID=174260 RepID=A0A9W9YB53_9CNID|nr:Sperm-associated antigen 17 [Desmophyllum pertusum]
MQELDTEKKTEFGTAIFEDVADVCYNMLDHLQQYKQYLDSMTLIRVPVHSNASASAASINQPSSEQLPGSQSDNSCSGLFATVDDKNPLDQVVPPRGEGLNHDLAAYISSKTSKLALLQNGKQVVTEPTDSNKPREPQKSPVILHYRDAMTSRLHQLEPANGLDPEEAELRMLDLFPKADLKNCQNCTGGTWWSVRHVLMKLRYFCNSHMNSSEFLERALKQFTFEGMLLKIANQNGDIVDLREVDESFKALFQTCGIIHIVN